MLRRYHPTRFLDKLQYKLTSSPVPITTKMPEVVKAIAAVLNKTKEASGFLGVPPLHPTRFLDTRWQCQTCYVVAQASKLPRGSCSGVMAALPNIADGFNLTRPVRHWKVGFLYFLIYSGIIILQPLIEKMYDSFLCLCFSLCQITPYFIKHELVF